MQLIEQVPTLQPGNASNKSSSDFLAPNLQVKKTSTTEKGTLCLSSCITPQTKTRVVPNTARAHTTLCFSTKDLHSKI